LDSPQLYISNVCDPQQVKLAMAQIAERMLEAVYADYWQAVEQARLVLGETDK
jgi:hypothetical protein